jgi:hypothetical protein
MTPEDTERPCIKCGVVDQVKNMVRLAAYLPADPDWPETDEPDYEAWVHEIPCYRDYNAVVTRLGLIDFEQFLERPETQAQLQKKGKAK